MLVSVFFFCKQKTAYEMRISDLSSDVCSSDLGPDDRDRLSLPAPTVRYEDAIETLDVGALRARWSLDLGFVEDVDPEVAEIARVAAEKLVAAAALAGAAGEVRLRDPVRAWLGLDRKSVVVGTSGSVRVGHGGGLLI